MRTFWGQNLNAAAQLVRVKDMTQGECARALRDPDTQPATKGALVRRLRAFNAQRLNPPATVRQLDQQLQSAAGNKTL